MNIQTARFHHTAIPGSPAGSRPRECNRLKLARFGNSDQYDNSFLKTLFDDMGSVYESISSLGSLGFSRIWRQQAINLLKLKPGETVLDLMGGTGESWKQLLKPIGPHGKLISLDLSTQMSQIAQKRKGSHKADNILVVQGDACNTPLADASIDAIFIGFGVKTLPKSAYAKIVTEAKRVLKPGGRLSLAEISMPEHKWHQGVYKLYMKMGFPVLKLMLGKDKAQRFQMVERYLDAFQNPKALATEFKAAGFDVQYKRFLGDGAAGLVAVKPE